MDLPVTPERPRRTPFPTRAGALTALLRGRREGMVETRPVLDLITHLVLILGVVVIAFPVYVTFVASTITAEEVLAAPMSLLPGPHLFENYREALVRGAGNSAAPVWQMMTNSLVSALIIAIGKIAISLISAFAIVYFRFPLRNFFFWMIFVTLMLPVEVRILPTYKVVSDLGMLDSYAGLTLPLIASATATFLFRQFFLTIPDELAEAARIDGAGPLRFFWDVVVPMSKTSVAALFVIQFIYGWNQYLWPLIVTTKEDYYTVVIGIKRMIAGGGEASVEWHLVMATAIMAMLPPAVVVLLMQRWFVKGQVDTEKKRWRKSTSTTCARATARSRSSTASTRTWPTASSS
jgi:sn-glycerol 3-phosphate transport system permease protein